MADDLTQKLGFDASDAINELKRLQTALADGGTALKQFSVAATSVEKSAPGVISAWDQMIGRAQLLKQTTLDANIAMGRLGTAGVASAKALAMPMPGSTQTLNLAGNAKALEASALSAKSALWGLGTAGKGSAIEISQGLSNATNSTKQLGEVTKDTGRSMVISWQTIGRVIQAQIIVRALSAIVQAFGDAQTAAREFSKAIGEISTISGTALGGIDEISVAVLKLSSQLGLAPTEVAEGLYQTISNQVVEVGESYRFMSEMGRLAISTQATLDQAVDAGSSIMNAYGLSVAETAHVADVLFDAVNYGRFRLSEISDTLGRVMPDTRLMGIAWEEVMASLAAMTQQGVSADTAITQLHQLTVKLLKPSKALQSVYDKWGTKTGPETIRRFGGLNQVLRALQIEAGGNVKVFADYMSRERSLTGAANLLADSSARVTEVLNSLGLGAGNAAEAFRKMESTIGRKSTKALNDIQVSLTRFGQSLLTVTTPAIQLFNDVLQNMDSVLAVSSAALLMYVLHLNSLAKATAIQKGLTLSWTTSLGSAWKMIKGMGPAIIAMGAAFVATRIKDWIDDINDTATEVKMAIEGMEEKLTEAHEKETLKRVKATETANKDQIANTSEYFNTLSGLYRSDAMIATASSKAVENALSASLAAIFKKKTDLVSVFKNANLEADAAIKASQDSIRSAQTKKEDIKFEQKVNRIPEPRKADEYRLRAVGTLSKANMAYYNAGANEEKLKVARELSNLAETQAKEAQTQSQKTGWWRDEENAQSLLNNIYDSRIAKEQGAIALRQSASKKATAAEIADIEKTKEEVKNLADQVSELRDPWTKQGAPKGENQRVKDLRVADQLTTEIIRKQQADFSKHRDLYKSWGIDEAMLKLNAEIPRALSTAQIDWTKSLNNLATALADKTRWKIAATIEVTSPEAKERYEKQFGEFNPLGDPGQINSQAQQVFQGIVEDWNAARETIGQTTGDLSADIAGATDALATDNWYTAFQRGMVAYGQIASDLPSDAATVNKLLTTSTTQTELIRQKLLGSVQILKTAVTAHRDLTQPETRSLDEIISDWKDVAASGKLSTSQIANGEIAVKQLVKGMETLKTKTQAAKDISKLAPSYLEAKKALDEQDAAAKRLNETQKGVKNEVNATGTGLTALGPAAAQGAAGVVTATDTIIAAMSRADSAAATLAQRLVSYLGSIGSAGPSAMASHGGLLYRAGGGLSRGTDTRPAMLTPGEYVVNAKSSRRFYSQLTAMNAGRAPDYHSTGGTTVGDVHINVTESTSGQSTAREIMQSLKRELRRKTFSF